MNVAIHAPADHPGRLARRLRIEALIALIHARTGPDQEGSAVDPLGFERSRNLLLDMIDGGLACLRDAPGEAQTLSIEGIATPPVTGCDRTLLIRWADHARRELHSPPGTDPAQPSERTHRI